MRSSWRTVLLGEATESQDSRRVPVKASDRRPGPYPYWGASGVVDHVDGYIYDHPSLLVSEDGENLRTRKTPIAFYANGKYWVNNHAHVLTARKGFDLKYLTYQVGHADVAGYITGSTQPKLTAASLARIPIPAPAFEEQRQIAGVLGALDDLIYINRALTECAESLAAALASSSVDKVQLGELASLANFRQFRPDGSVDHFSIPTYDQDKLPERVDGASIKSAKLLLVEPSVLVSRLNPQTPRIWMAYPDGVPAAASTEFVPLVGTDSVSVEELWAVCAADEFAAQMIARVTGTTGSHQRVDKAAILQLFVADVRKLDRSARVAITALVRQANASLVTASEVARVRDKLLPLLLSGQVQVEDMVK